MTNEFYFGKLKKEKLQTTYCFNTKNEIKWQQCFDKEFIWKQIYVLADKITLNTNLKTFQYKF